MMCAKQKSPEQRKQGVFLRTLTWLCYLQAHQLFFQSVPGTHHPPLCRSGVGRVHVYVCTCERVHMLHEHVCVLGEAAGREVCTQPSEPAGRGGFGGRTLPGLAFLDASPGWCRLVFRVVFPGT